MNFPSWGSLAVICIASITASCHQRESFNLFGQKIGIPRPADLVPVADKAPDYRKMVEAFRPEMTTLEIYLTPEELANLVHSRDALRRRSCYAGAFNAVAGSDSDQAAFSAASDELRKSARMSQGVSQSSSEVTQVSRRVSGESGGVSGSVESLSVFIDGKNVIAVEAFGDIRSQGSVTHQIATKALVRVRNRQLVLGCGAIIRNVDDTSWVEETTRTWAEAVLSANQG